MKHFYYCLTYLFLSLVCSGTKAQSITYSSAIPVEKQRIVIDHAKGGIISDWINDLTYTPLETKNKRDAVQSVFKMTLIGSSIGILSFHNGKTMLYIYSTDGNFIKAIDCIKSSRLPKDESIHNMKVWNDHFVLSSENYKIKIDEKGNNVVLLEERSRAADSMQIGESVWTYTKYDSVANSEIALTLNNTPVIKYKEKKNKHYIDKETYFSPVSLPHGASYFCPDNHYKIFELGEFKINKIYDLIFPQHNIVDTSLIYNSTSDFMKNIQEDKIYSLDNIIRHGDFLIFKAGFYTFYSFNLITKDFINFSNIIPDRPNDYMDFISHYAIVTDGEYLFTLMTPYLVREAIEICKEEKHVMRTEYQRLAKQNNLILVRFKLKS